MSFSRLLLMSTLALSACSAPVPPSETTQVKEERMQNGFRLLASGQNGRAAQRDDPSVGRRAPFVVVANSSAEYLRLWGEHIGSNQPPAVDFARESVVFLLMSVQSTGGYSIEPRTVRREGGVTEVDAKLEQPDRGSIVTQAVTAPFVVLAIEGRAGRVEWKSDGGLLAQSAE